MEFLEFLNSKEKEILALIYKAEYSAEENTPLCLLGKKFFGFFKKKQKTVVICTQNAKDISGYSFPKSGRYDDDFNQTGIYLRRALRHEAVHVAQDCNNGKPLNIISIKKRKLNPYKEKALLGSTSVSGHKDKEYEAYLIEDKPNTVIEVLEKFCF